MSNFLYSDFPDAVPMNMDTKYFAGDLDMLQYVNPQDTDKQYRSFEDSHPPTFSSGLMTPPQTILECTSRRPSLMIASTPASCNGGPESASSTSSFESFPGCPSSCPSSASTAPSSRRQSVVYSDTQQPYNYSSAASSPLFRCGLRKGTSNLDQQLVPGSYSTDELGIIPNTIAYTVLGEVGTDGVNDGPFGVADSRLAWTNRDPVAYGTPGQPTLSVDLGPGFKGSLAPARSIEYFQPNLKALRPDNLSNLFSQEAIASQSAITLSPSTLGPSWQHKPGGHDQEMSCSDEEIQPTIFEKGRRRNQNLRVRQNLGRVGGKGEKHKCPWCIPPAKYECNRPEHLKRHCAAKHPEESGEHQERYTCNFPDCIDKKTGEVKVIIARGDNYKAHYNKTHFSYGNTEKTGKNIRKSMKMSIEKGLRSTDTRWTMMLAGKMRVGEDANDTDDKKSVQQKFPSVWKMIGYSIKETREIKVKDIAPDWQGPDDTKLEKFDCRWKALKNGELTYEQAMSVGTDMLETPRQGLLGVDMSESKEMGLAFHDPRWQMLRSGRMTMEDAAKLGVGELTSQARRKR